MFSLSDKVLKLRRMLLYFLVVSQLKHTAETQTESHLDLYCIGRAAGNGFNCFDIIYYIHVCECILHTCTNMCIYIYILYR